MLADRNREVDLQVSLMSEPRVIFSSSLENRNDIWGIKLKICKILKIISKSQFLVELTLYLLCESIVWLAQILLLNLGKGAGSLL